MRVSPKKFFLFLLLLLLLGYGFWQARFYLRGPQIYLDFPEEGAVLATSILELKGRAFEISRLTLNGYPIYINETGEFKEGRVLSPGLNIIQLEGTDRFGHTKTIQRMVFMK